MLFVMRTRDGMTKDLARRLARSETGAADIWMTVEGPYGGCTDTEQFHEILLVAGGSGISHIMSSASSSPPSPLARPSQVALPPPFGSLTLSHDSLAVLADILHKARNSYSRATRVRVVWTVQSVEQSVWTLKELLHSAKTAYEAGVQLEIELYVTRGMAAPSPETVDLMTKELPPPPTLQQRRASVMSVNSYAESPIADALTILPGRPHIDVIVPRWIANAQGKSLVVGASSLLFLLPLHTSPHLFPPFASR